MRQLILKLKSKYGEKKIVKIMKSIYHHLWLLEKLAINFFFIIIFYFFRLFPIKNNKIVLSSFSGKIYGGNSRFIAEELYKMNSQLDLVWLKDDDFDYSVPKMYRTVSFWKNSFKRIYEYSTAKVWVDTHLIRSYIRKRNAQLFIETWHGGLGIKKLEKDITQAEDNILHQKEIENMCKLADFFISNSDHLTRIYRETFDYKGVIWEVGYPQNDILMRDIDHEKISTKIRAQYNIGTNTKIMVYAPTFRKNNEENDYSMYDIDYERLHETLIHTTGEEWVIFVKYHPVLLNKTTCFTNSLNDVINITDFLSMQEIVVSADAFISDYSSCIFDAAIREIPCFIYASDYQSYKRDRGVYYELEELPFSFAENNEDLNKNIQNFNYEQYLLDWNVFKQKTALYESGHAARDIAYLINEYISGNTDILSSINKCPIGSSKS